ncbi:MAG: SprT family zinc-dependent metalloprotease [Rhodospirillaceae bacterium]
MSGLGNGQVEEGGCGAPGLDERVIVEVRPRARRLSLRVEPSRDCIVLVRPKRASDRAVARFAAEHADWIERQLAALPARVPLAHGAVIPYRGVDHVVSQTAGRRGPVTCQEGVIRVGGQPEHCRRRLTDWLKGEARTTLSELSREMARSIDVKVSGVTVRDTRTRWGSCAPNGRLSFSWRLILAPEFVLTYVAAHEVAHLRHANHSRAFWRTVEKLLEPYGVSIAAAREWMNRSGAGLHRYG